MQTELVDVLCILLELLFGRRSIPLVASITWELYAENAHVAIAGHRLHLSLTESQVFSIAVEVDQ